MPYGCQCDCLRHRTLRRHRLSVYAPSSPNTHGHAHRRENTGLALRSSRGAAPITLKRTKKRTAIDSAGISKTVFAGYRLKPQGSAGIPLHTASLRFLTKNEYGSTQVSPPHIPLDPSKRHPLYCLSFIHSREISRVMALPKGDPDPIKCACLLACFPAMPVHYSRHDKIHRINFSNWPTLPN